MCIQWKLVCWSVLMRITYVDMSNTRYVDMFAFIIHILVAGSWNVLKNFFVMWPVSAHIHWLILYTQHQKCFGSSGTQAQKET
jgi:hypothetical protein